jgi:hypothetical protein
MCVQKVNFKAKKNYKFQNKDICKTLCNQLHITFQLIFIPEYFVCIWLWFFTIKLKMELECGFTVTQICTSSESDCAL